MSRCGSSFVMRSEKHAVFFSGDTGLTTEYEVIRDRLGPFDLVMLEVGAFHPAWGDWDQPAELLLELGAKGGVQLIMPRLGEPVEPAHAGRVEPWWRQVDAFAQAPTGDAPTETSLPKAMSWPID
jgi:hypothetical protein